MLLIPSAGIWSELSKWRRFDILQDSKDLGTLKLYKYGRQRDKTWLALVSSSNDFKWLLTLTCEEKLRRAPYSPHTWLIHTYPSWASTDLHLTWTWTWAWQQDMTMPWHRGGLTSDKTTMRDGTQDRGGGWGQRDMCQKLSWDEKGRTSSKSQPKSNCWLRKSKMFQRICPYFGSYRSSLSVRTSSLSWFKLWIFFSMAQIFKQSSGRL